MGIAVADFDSDGKLDIFVTGFGGSALYRNLAADAIYTIVEGEEIRETNPLPPPSK